jgi:transposase-like protein
MGKRGKKIDDKTREEIRAALAADPNISRVAKAFGVSRAVVRKIRDEKPDEYATLRPLKSRNTLRKHGKSSTYTWII